MKRLFIFCISMVMIIFNRLCKCVHHRKFYCACGNQNYLGICPECGTESGARKEYIQGLL